MKITLCGIPNCDQVKKARAWLDARGTNYHFHDFKKAGLTEERILSWLATVQWEALINRKGTTWRALPQERQAAVADAESAIALMLENPSVIKRPVLTLDTTTYVGFSLPSYEDIFSKADNSNE